MEKKLSLEKELQSYRVLHTPTLFSVKQHWAKAVFSHDNLFDCNEEERKKFNSVLDECLITYAPIIKTTECSIINFNKLLEIITDPNNKNLNKKDRQVIYTSNNGVRPIGKKAFDIWGGFQVIDMDIKDKEIASLLKKRLFDRLKKYNWFFGIVMSSSGAGIHIYTKIQVPDELPKDKRKLLYLTNFRHKYSFVYLASLMALEDTDKTKDDLVKWMDLAMFRPQQGAYIPYDPNPLINTHFFEDFIYVNFDNVEDMGHPDVDWVSHPDLKEIFKRWEWFEEDDKPLDIEVINAEDYNGSVSNKYHYKHFERWKLANTLVKLYGLENGYKYLRLICTNDIKDKELLADCKTADTHSKPVEAWAINRLNKYHGFNIKVKIDNEEADISELYSSTESISDNPCLIKESSNTRNFYINKDQYLSDIRDELLSSMGRITLIDAGAGTGKTEMVKELANMNKRVMMVMPFTSTIKSKVEGDDKWYYSYGNRKVRFDKQPCVALTIDKFSKLNLMEIKEQGFDYIFIDESHLLFQSEYRPIMPKVIEMIRNTEIPIILMSGTPVGETVFFPDIVHLKVTKEETRKKVFKVNITDSPDDNLFYMCRSIAKDITKGRRILFPTNKGTKYKEQVECAIKYFLENEFFYFDPIKIEYYKKSNIGEDFMDQVNFNKTVADLNVLMCSTFLSVGVDILDRYDFNIYFNELWMPQETEQFANRLRNHDLYIKLFINRKNSEGESLNICSFHPCNLYFEENELKDVQSIIRMCNGMIERNPIEYKYNSLISSIIRENKFIEYNEVENKYYVNEIAYKTIYFERKYRDYVQQLPVLCRGMQSYGYEYISNDLGVFQAADGVNAMILKDCMREAKNKQKDTDARYIEELIDLITEDRLSLYKSVLQGKFSIKKGRSWKEDLMNNSMTVKSIEVFEKVVPLFVSMSKMFDVEDVRDIFDFCKDGSNHYNFSAINRIRLLINIIYNDKRNRIDLPIKEYMNDIYQFLDDSPDDKTTKQELKEFILKQTVKYANMESKGGVIITRSPITMEKIEKTLTNIFKCLVTVGRAGKDGMVSLKKNELLWTEKEIKEQHKRNIQEHIFNLGDFLDCIEVKEEAIENTTEF